MQLIAIAFWLVYWRRTTRHLKAVPFNATAAWDNCEKMNLWACMVALGCLFDCLLTYPLLAELF